MKTRGLSLLVTALLLATARGDLTLVEKIEGSGPLSQITIKLKGDKAKVEASPELTTLFDNKTGDILTLMNGQKKIVRISAEKSKAIAELASKYSKNSSAGVQKAKLMPTGKKDTINGNEVEEYVRESPSMKETYWIALKYPDSAAIVKELQSIAPSAWNDIAKGVFDFKDFPGLPLKTIVKTDRMEVTSTIVSIKQDPLSDSEFAVPKDFEELKVPNLHDMLSEKQAHAPVKP